MAVRAKTTIYPGTIKRLDSKVEKAIIMTAEQLRTEVITAQVLPFKEGTLQNIATYVEPEKAKQGVVSIVTDAPYAARLYFHPEYDFTKTTNPQARGQWWEDWLTGTNKDRPKKLFKAFLRGLVGG